jgi:hypothetical protein
MNALLKHELDKEAFVQQLVANGWSREEADAEWEAIQSEPEEL